MGTFLNPGNSGFAEMLQSRYIDKTGMIALINSTIGKKEKLTCISRPRRFGKSYAAQMLCAYYDKSCDSSRLFHGLKISEDKAYRKYLNQYDVIYVDMTGTKPYTDDYRELIPFLCSAITEELAEAYPALKQGNTLLMTPQQEGPESPMKKSSRSSSGASAWSTILRPPAASAKATSCFWIPFR